MPKYKCLNKECPIYEEIKSRDSRGYYDRVLQKVMDTGAVCPECGDECELQLPEEYSTNLINRP